MIPNLFQALYEYVRMPLEAGFDALLNAYIAWVQTWAIVAIALVIGFRGLEVAFGRGDLPRFWSEVATAAVLVLIASSVGLYDEWVRTPLLGLSDELGRLAAEAFANGNVGSGAAAYDALLKDGLLQGLRVWQSLGWSDIGPSLAVLLFWAAVIVSDAFTFVIWFGAGIFLLLLLSVGPVMLALAAFKTTRGKAYRWLDAVALQIVLVALATGFIQAILAAEGMLLEQFATPNGSSIQKILGLLIGGALFGVAVWLVKDLPNKAAALTGSSGGHHGIGAATALTFGFIGGMAARATGAARRRR